MTKRKRSPFPEALGRLEAWTIIENAQARTSLLDGRMRVPLGRTKYEAFSRSHELAHVKWSPAKPDPTLDQLLQQTIEDCRLNHMLIHRAGIPLPGLPQSLEALQHMITDAGHHGRTRFLAIIGALARSLPDMVANEDYLFEGLSETSRRAVELGREAHRMVTEGAGSDLIPFEKTVEVTRWLEARVPKPSSQSEEQLLLLGLGLPKPGAGEDDRSGSRPNSWGAMLLETPPRPLQVKAHRYAKRRRATDMGHIPVRMHRLLTDGQVFTDISKSQTGSVLVDMSGSMGLSSTDLENILQKTPALRIACYSGDDTTGVLRILADKGRRVTPEKVSAPSGSSNVIDGPALQWLAAQPGPRVWMSDGSVTGIGDRSAASLTRETRQIVKQAKITRVETADQIQQFFQGRLKRAT